ncbi:excinuclease ABC subunit B [Candidatus Peribacteria bacterium RIFOXYC2_FULL_55_14]|nr:MAG: UvrABC system protein B [Candidatus Peribacteria bacterium GW2011_GWC2_54_8]KKW44367.1 MAG: UvrABC system protein B [Candidatus Peregrinibacteria bacterium GW2011_GWA2_54_9]OGJ72392.1 MAG: excinuclease ABC subunit B [Candidatus Peribacteria bacterium RIFOXYA1_FULL_56_14]OGJ73441.1 MAG: excinuclease ABC subunit B [Candidatus Peribacteria bacterium RIFOXYA2_FULL_55_28]OGJ74623.1 MAG: excinuclease ABC subunit B [Candidatus Peribacteria bacterium RIFOXYB1_FULL_54_35]OGJ76788.1 MAG: excinuc
MPEAQPFQLVSDFSPTGDQPQAIAQLLKGLKAGERHQTLLGATGTGKTFTMANIIHEVQRPTLVLAHNKTLAAQLCSEFQGFFPGNAVSYFVSYYDYYQPEAYLPTTDTYIEKDASINEEIAKYRHAATFNLLTRRDVLVVASVSCIYGLGNVEDYEALAIKLTRGEAVQRDKFLRRLTDIQYRRSAMEFKQGMFHVLGDTVEVFPPGGDTVFRLEMPFDEIETIQEVDSFTGELIADLNEITIFPASHNVTTQEKIERAVAQIVADLDVREKEMLSAGEIAKAERLRQRTEYDLEMLRETGYCTGIENYVRYLNNTEPGQPPSTLLDYFPKDFLLFVDESHITVPQIGGMFEGNFSRKQTLVEYGFRLPSSHDNRPLKFGEFEERVNQAIYVSATPSRYEKEHTKKQYIAEQVIRPTGLLDPKVEVKTSKNQIDDITEEINQAIKRGERALITTLTKKMSEKLNDYLLEQDFKVRYLHSDIETLERIEILRQLRTGEIDLIVGINLLREGLDLPEVSYIAILDADKQGFLRSRDALIQTIGRCARNVHGHVTLYATPDPKTGKPMWTDAMRQAVDETNRRREIQEAYNKKHGITPKSIEKAVHDISEEQRKMELRRPKRRHEKIPKDEKKRLIEELEQQMELASQNLEFEKAADLRDEIELLRREL